MFGSSQPRKRPGPPAEKVEIPHPWDEKTSPGPGWDEAPETPIPIPPIFKKKEVTRGHRGHRRNSMRSPDDSDDPV